MQAVEAVLLYISQHYGQLSRPAQRQLKPTVTVTMTTMGAQEGYNARVSAHGFGAYYLNGDVFLRTLCESPSWLGSLSGQTRARLLCRRIGEYSNVLAYELVGNPPSHEIHQSLTPTPPDFPPGGLLMTFTQPASQAPNSKLSAQLHLLHLAFPEVCLVLEVQGGGVVFPWESHYWQIPRSPFKLVTALHHYMEHSSIPPRQSKLHLRRGHTYALSLATLGSGLPLKVHCSVAVIPHVPLRKGKRVPADRLCTNLQVTIFGPSGLPLLGPASHAAFPLTSLALWDNYGLTIGPPLVPNYHGGHVIHSLSYELSRGRGRRESATRITEGHSLLLIVFLAVEGERRGDWEQSFCLTQELRAKFDGLMVEQCKKFQQAAHSALNKLICNYSTYNKTSLVLGTGIPLLSEAVASIVQHSTNKGFKDRCRTLMNGEEPQDWVDRALWGLAREKQHISHPSEPPSHNPDEPTTPEVLQAMADRQEGSPRQTVRTGQQTERQSKTGESTKETCGSSTFPHPSTTSQSLFQARIASRHKGHCPLPSQPPYLVGDEKDSTGLKVESSEVEGRGTECSGWLEEEFSESMLSSHAKLAPGPGASDGGALETSFQDLTISFTDSEMDVSGFDSECDEMTAQVVPQCAHLALHKGSPGSDKNDSSVRGDPFDSLDLTEAATPTTTSGEESFSDGQWEDFLSPLPCPPINSTPLLPTAAPAILVPPTDSLSCDFTEEDLCWDESVPAPHPQSLCSL